MENFLIIRLSSLGDIIHTLPAFSALRKKFPRARISWVVERKGKEILDFVPGIDEVIVVNTEDWRAKNIWKEISQLKSRIKKRSQTALDFQGLIKSGLISYLSRSRRRIGFRRKNLKEPLASLFYNERLEEIPEDIHVIKKNLKLLEKVGLQEERYAFPIQLPSELSATVKARIKEVGYEEEKKLGLSPRDAMVTALSKIGRAIVTTALTTLGGFGVLIVSNFVMIRDFGIATVIGVFLCMVITLTVMPGLIVRYDEWRMKRLYRER